MTYSGGYRYYMCTSTYNYYSGSVYVDVYTYLAAGAVRRFSRTQPGYFNILFLFKENASLRNTRRYPIRWEVDVSRTRVEMNIRIPAPYTKYCLESIIVKHSRCMLLSVMRGWGVDQNRALTHRALQTEARDGVFQQWRILHS